MCCSFHAISAPPRAPGALSSFLALERAGLFLCLCYSPFTASEWPFLFYDLTELTLLSLSQHAVLSGYGASDHL